MERTNTETELIIDALSEFSKEDLLDICRFALHRDFTVDAAFEAICAARSILQRVEKQEITDKLNSLAEWGSHKSYKSTTEILRYPQPTDDCNKSV